MASSKVMHSNSTNSDLNYLHHSHNYNPNPDHDHNSIPNNQFHDHTQINVNPVFSNDNSNLINDDITLLDVSNERKTVEDLWREIVAGKKTKECKIETTNDEMMTLEDFIERATADEVENNGVFAVKAEESGGIFGFDDQGVRIDAYSMAEIGVRRKRGRRSGGVMNVLEGLDKVDQKKMTRMIKNRESAARSRERKQAYQLELEALAAKLEEENEQLLKEKEDRTKQRYNQLMEKVVPVVEKRRPPRTLRRVRSMEW